MNDIVKILQQNARISDAALGEMLGISAEEAAAEIEKLEKSGVIKGYSVIVDDDLYDNWKREQPASMISPRLS